ncbi:MAG: hypothetical protein IKP10_07380 [Clostridia bacterium]|nr:hypothetical protein [Clostridia bacterium]
MLRIISLVCTLALLAWQAVELIRGGDPVLSGVLVGVLALVAAVEVTDLIRSRKTAARKSLPQ